MPKRRHINFQKQRESQRAIQAKARLEKQNLRGSKKFGSGQPHNGDSRGQSGLPGRKR